MQEGLFVRIGTVGYPTRLSFSTDSSCRKNIKGKMKRGWIRLYRKSFDNKLYFEEPFTKWQAWIDLLLLAAYEDRTFYVRGNPVQLKKGEIAQSTRVLRKRWKWSRAKVIRYLRALEMEHKVRPQKSNIINRIQIVNFQLYQQTIPLTSPQNPLNESTEKPIGESTDESTVIRSKEVKERLKKRIKTIQPKNRYGEFKNVQITKKEYENLLKTYGKANTEKVISEMDIYIGSTGKIYKNYYLAMLGFIRRRPADYPMPEEKGEDMIDIMKKGSKPK